MASESMAFKRHEWSDPLIDWLADVLRTWVQDGPGAASAVLARVPPGSLPHVPESYPGHPRRHAAGTRFGVSVRSGAPPYSLPSGQKKVDLWTQVYERDGYRCGYCERRVIAPVVVGLLAWGFSEDPNWPCGRNFVQCHPALLPRYPAVDHVWPLRKTTDSGHPRDPRNLVTACWRCNATKSNHFVEELMDWPPPVIARVDGRFDGLMGLAGRVYEDRRPGPPVQPIAWPSAALVQQQSASAMKYSPAFRGPQAA